MYYIVSIVCYNITYKNVNNYLYSFISRCTYFSYYILGLINPTRTYTHSATKMSFFIVLLLAKTVNSIEINNPLPVPNCRAKPQTAKRIIRTLQKIYVCTPLPCTVLFRLIVLNCFYSMACVGPELYTRQKGCVDCISPIYIYKFAWLSSAIVVYWWLA